MRSRRRWAVLAAGVAAQTAASAVVYGVPFLVPMLRDERGLSLAAVGRGRGRADPRPARRADRLGRGGRPGRRAPPRWRPGSVRAAWSPGVLALLAPQSIAVAVALLVLAGIGAASVNAASGRLIMGWFDVDERGLAMGIRQTAQPLGVAAAGLALPTLALSEGSFAALGWPALACLVCAVLVLVVAATRRAHRGNPATPRPPRPTATPSCPGCTRRARCWCSRSSRSRRSRWSTSCASRAGPPARGRVLRRGRPARRRRRAHSQRLVVRPRRLPPAPDAPARGGQRRRLLVFALRRPDPRASSRSPRSPPAVGDHRRRQRPRLHRHRRDRRHGLVRARPRRAEHHPEHRRDRRAAGARGVHRRLELRGGLRPGRPRPARGHRRHAGPPSPSRNGSPARVAARPTENDRVRWTIRRAVDADAGRIGEITVAGWRNA